jgi:hypothetical protein
MAAPKTRATGWIGSKFVGVPGEATATAPAASPVLEVLTRAAQHGNVFMPTAPPFVGSAVCARVLSDNIHRLRNCSFVVRIEGLEG